MKKKSIVLATLLFSVLAPIFANEHGFKFGLGGLSSIMLKPYTYEQVGYSYKWDSGFFAGGDIRFLENIIPSSKEEPIVHFMFGPTFGYKNFYLSGGAFFFIHNNTVSIEEISFYVRTGASFSPWQWGKGKGGMDIGLEFSPTLYIPNSESGLESGLVVLFGTLFNLIKLNVGVTYYLPL